ncbi:MAG: phosphate ABC transporter permease family protein, partial [Pseudomonadota bacterium]|nr:phosphate ABC transporter permease family protein [Pseudomonadota bacterium]
MQPTTLTLVLLALAAAGYQLGRHRALALARGSVRNLHSLPSHYGSVTALAGAVPAFLLLLLWVALQPFVITQLVVAELPAGLRELPPGRLSLVVNDIRNVAAGNVPMDAAGPAIRAAAGHYQQLQRLGALALTGLTLALAAAGIGLAWRRLSPALRARNGVESAVKVFLIASSTVAIFTTVGIVGSVLFEAIRFFQHVPVSEFLFGLEWSPQMAIRADQAGSSGAFGAVPLFAGTLLIAAIAMA